MNTYKPGQSVRFTLSSTILGVYADPSALVLTVHFPDGTQIANASPVRDFPGGYHGDLAIPSTMKPGIGIARWHSSGSQADQNAIIETQFVVAPLEF